MSSFECKKCQSPMEIFLKGTVISKIRFDPLHDDTFVVSMGTELPEIKATTVVMQCPVCPLTKVYFTSETVKRTRYHDHVKQGKATAEVRITEIALAHGDIIKLNKNQCNQWHSVVYKGGKTINLKRLIRREQVNDL